MHEKNNQIKLVVTSSEELERIMYKVVTEVLKNKTSEKDKTTFYTKKEVMKILKIGFDKLKKLIEAEKIQLSPNGKISKYELNKFLENENK